MLRRTFVLFGGAFILLLPSAAQSFHLNQEQTEQLSQHPVWLKLLHADRNGGQSEILSDDFFLSPTGKHDPRAELLATVAAYDAPWPDNGDSHARCRFPARYYWLSQQVALPSYRLDPPQCRTFARWSLPNKVQSVSLFLVSGYLGNPASIFGHSLLKLNTGVQDDQAGLFDLTVNYGALVPQDEPVWRYVLRGIGGGYQAGFSDRYFYTQDLLYSRTEFRDIWNYELLLTERQRILLVLHLWEVLGRKFTYYFLDKNCAYRLAELLELVLDDPLLTHAKAWCAPVEIFHRLAEIDRTRKAAGQRGLVRAVQFIPSAQRRLHHQFSLLRPEEQAAAEAVIQHGTEALQGQLAQLKPERQAELLDALFAYANYRITAEQPAPSTEANSLKKRILHTRFLLPPQTTLPEAMPELDSPTQGNPPMLTGLGLGYDEKQGAHLHLRWAPFTQEGLGRNGLEGDELALLDTTVGFGGNDDDFFIDTLDLIKIRKIKSSNILAAEQENPWSWQLRSGVRQDSGEYDALFAFGAGRAWKISPQVTTYVMTDAAAHSQEPYLRLRPHLAALIGQGQLKAQVQVGLETTDYAGDAQSFIGAELQWSLGAQTAVFAGVEQAEHTQLSIELKWFW